MAVEVWQLGRMAYQDALELQGRLVEERSRDATPDHLLLLEHPHTYTLGTSGHEENLLLSPAERKRLGVEVFHVDRGGDITYHGPGQLVGYPIICLPRPKGGGLRANTIGFIRNIETTLIHALADYDITAKTISGLTGVWVDTPDGEAKVCAIGAKINVRGVTKHGFALNVNTDMRYFEGIVPCGITDKGVTSMARILGEPVNMDEVASRVIAHFGDVFDVEMTITEPDVVARQS
jgi:lipoyl(octanoyl) transferase